MMKYIYDGIFHEAIFISRLNRFLAEVLFNGNIVLAHVKNTGRMTELLVKGNICYIMEAKNSNRKTKYDLITIISDNQYINLDSQIPNKIIADAFENSQIEGYEKVINIKREYTIGSSRLDMKVDLEDRELYVEVKGVDLIKDGLAMFPDAPTIRGTKHLLELEKIVKAGGEAMVIFLVARTDAKSFRPHFERDPVFADSFYKVINSGVQARVYLTNVGPNFIELSDRIPIKNINELK